MNVQDRLNEAYRPLVDLSVIHDRLGKHKASDVIDVMLRELNGPFLIATNLQYETSKPRVIIVGQENNGWNDKCDYYSFLLASGSADKALHDVLCEYKKFDLEHSYNRLFFQYFAQIRDKIREGESGDTQRSILWSNLFKLNHNGKPSIRSPYYEDMLEVQYGVFQQEINILRPDALIFLTGPKYDEVIKQFYQDAEFTPVEGCSERQLAHVAAQGLPKLTFRSYHPGFINRKKAARMPWYDRIIEQVRTG